MTESSTTLVEHVSTVSIPKDIERYLGLGVLDVLLADRSTEQNIIWATSAYEKLGDGFGEYDQIKIDQITGEHAELIKRRAQKDKDQKTALTRVHAEVFTPTWICKLMIDQADDEWYTDAGMKTAQDDWRKYVESKRLEITCGEAPYLVNRYDAADGEPIPVPERIGILDRKFQAITSNTKRRQDWMCWARKALKATFGYEFQGDNLLIARINVLKSVEDHLSQTGYKELSKEELADLSEIVSWNLWQMDGMTGCVPFGKIRVEKPMTLFPGLFEDDEPEEDDGRGEAVIKDWNKEAVIRYGRIKQEGKNMKFDYVIGNPPYQEEQEGDNKNFAPPIYNKFMDGSYEVADRVELITPARFLFDAGSTPKAWNKKMLSDPHLKVLYYEADSSKVFPTTDIKGGVAITYRDTTKDFGAIETFVSFEELRSIMKKVTEKGEPSLKDIVYASESYRFTDKMHEDLPNAEALLSKGHKYDLKTSVLKTLDGIAFFDAPKPDAEYVEIIGLIDQKRVSKWIRRDYIKGPDNFEHFKVILPAANGSGAIGEVLSTPLIGAPLIGHTQTFISIGSFDTEEEAEACMKYVKSKFARTLLGVLKITQHNPGPKWKYVLLQDFTSSSDIDWSQSVHEIDEQLYKKYGLSDDEIEFIEIHVKAMD